MAFHFAREQRELEKRFSNAFELYGWPCISETFNRLGDGLCLNVGEVVRFRASDVDLIEPFRASGVTQRCLSKESCRNCGICRAICNRAVYYGPDWVSRSR